MTSSYVLDCCCPRLISQSRTKLAPRNFIRIYEDVLVSSIFTQPCACARTFDIVMRGRKGSTNTNTNFSDAFDLRKIEDRGHRWSIGLILRIKNMSSIGTSTFLIEDQGHDPILVSP